MKLGKFLFIGFFIFVVQYMYAQSKVNVSISDHKNQPVAQANILIYTSLNGNFLAFGVSDKNGKFEVEVKGIMDSFFVQIEHLSFEPFYKTFKANHEHKIVLKERINALPEVKITHDRMQRSGDTLIYDVGQYKKANDVNIEDILRKLPGIEIESNGRILYNNEPISQFYIEGLDMLGGRYKIATRGLNVDVVSEIQVLERHQHIKALKNIVIPTSAAINIKLKSGITHTGEYEGGIGLSPLLYNAKGSLFGFSKGIQYNLIGAANNIGRNNRSLFENMIVTVVDGSQGNTSSNNLVDVTHPMTPRLRSEVYRQNNEKVFSLNFLKKLTNDLQIKYNAAAHSDRILMEGGNNLVLYDAINSFSINERISTLKRDRGMDHNLKIESNKNKLFFLANIFGETLPSTNMGNHVINSKDVVENLKKSMVKASADMKVIIRKGSKAFTILSYIDYQNIDDTLTILPASFQLPSIGLISLSKVDQFINRHQLKSHTYTSFNINKNQIKYELTTGIKTNQIWLMSDLKGINSNLDDQFRNDIYNGGINFYALQNVEKRVKRWSYGFRLPFSLQFFTLQSSEKPNATTKNKFLLYHPYAFISHEFTSKYSSTLSLSYNSNADFQQLYFDRYILTSNRNITRRLPNVFQSQGFNISSNHVFSNIFGKTDMFFTSFSWNRGSQNQLQINDFNTTSVISELRNQNNKVSGFSTTGMFKSEVFTRDLVFDFNYNIMINIADQILNQTTVRARTDLWYVYATLDYSPFDRLGLKCNVNYNRFSTNFSAAAHNIGYSGQIYINPYKNIDWKINFDMVQNNSLGQTTINKVFGSEVSYTLKAQKMNLSLYLFNLTNTKTYQSIRQNLFQLQESYFNLRPRQVFVSIKKLI